MVACPGMRSLSSIVACWPFSLAPGPTACLPAIEAESLLHNIHYGFPVLPEGVNPDDVPVFAVPNYPCPPAIAAAIRKGIDTELAEGILYELPSPPRQCTPLTYKEEAEGKIRTIRDYSAPHDGRTSVNDQRPAAHFRMMGMQDAYACMTPRCFMAKVDIKAAFRTVAVRPAHQQVLAFAWPDPVSGQPLYYADRRLPFGWRGSPEAFCRLSQAVRAMLAAKGYHTSMVYVDDFFVVDPLEHRCSLALQCLLDLLRALGFTVSEPKTVLPCQDLVMLGLRLESNVDGTGAMRVSVPEPKLKKAVEAVQELLGGAHRSRRRLQSTLGFLSHICQRPL